MSYQRVISRATNRVLVGIPLSAIVLVLLPLWPPIFSVIITWFPKPLKPCVARAHSIRVSFSIKPHFSIVSRMLSNPASKILQEIEFSRPLNFTGTISRTQDQLERGILWQVAAATHPLAGQLDHDTKCLINSCAETYSNST